jgi:anti-sigma-K factor RskA
MTDREIDLHGDAAAYALGALDAEEAARFRRHAEGCAECRAELEAHRATTGLLALGAPQLELPRSVRSRVLDEVHAEARRARRASRRGRARVGWGVPRPALGAGVLAVAAAAAVALAITLPGGGGTRVYRAAVVPGAASASVRVGAGRAQLIVRMLAAPPPGKVYEAWLARGGRATPAALFRVGAAGSAAVRLHGSLRGVRAVMVTVERRGGSATPTAAPVIIARL